MPPGWASEMERIGSDASAQQPPELWPVGPPRSGGHQGQGVLGVRTGMNHRSSKREFTSHQLYACQAGAGTGGNRRKILTGGLLDFRGGKQGPILIGWLEIDRDGLLYVLTHRSSHGTLIDGVLQKLEL